MKSNFKYVCVIAIFVLSIIVKLLAKSAGAPAHSTGAPGELTCSNSTCHAGKTAVLNIGSGVTSIKFEDSLNKFVAGKKYIVNVSISQDSLTKYGFQATALNDFEEGYGEISLKDSKKTLIHPPEKTEFLDRMYVDQSTNGNTFTSRKANWQFYWIAPDEIKGPVTFYVAYVAGNGDKANTGDYVYTNKLTVKPVNLKVEEKYSYDTKKMELK